MNTVYVICWVALIVAGIVRVIRSNKGKDDILEW